MENLSQHLVVQCRMGGFKTRVTSFKGFFACEGVKRLWKEGGENEVIKSPFTTITESHRSPPETLAGCGEDSRHVT